MVSFSLPRKKKPLVSWAAWGVAAALVALVLALIFGPSGPEPVPSPVMTSPLQDLNPWVPSGSTPSPIPPETRSPEEPPTPEPEPPLAPGQTLEG